MPANADELIDNMSLRPYVPLPIDGRYGVKEENIAEDSNGKKSKRMKVSQAKILGFFMALPIPLIMQSLFGDKLTMAGLS